MELTKSNSALFAEALAAATDPEAIKSLAAQAIATIATQEASLTNAAGQIETLGAQVTDGANQNILLTSKNAELEDHLDKATDMIADLQLKNDTIKKADKNYRPEASFEGAIYTIVHGLNLGDGKIASVDDIANNPKLLKQLVKSGSSAVKLKPAEETN
jgi:hypothetical protein